MSRYGYKILLINTDIPTLPNNQCLGLAATASSLTTSTASLMPTIKYNLRRQAYRMHANAVINIHTKLNDSLLIVYGTAVRLNRSDINYRLR